MEPRSIESETSSTAWCEPNRFETFFSSRTVAISVRNALLIVQPRLERSEAVFREESAHRDRPLLGAHAGLLVNERIVKPRGRRILVRACVVDGGGTRPVDGTEAHRTWFATRVQLASGELKAAEFRACLADRDHLSVRG